jgi:hypothetical protein
MPVTLKSNDSMRDHLTNFHLTDKPVGESTSSSDNYARYTPSKEEMTKIMELVENRTGLKFGKKDLRFFFHNPRGSRKACYRSVFLHIG